MPVKFKYEKVKKIFEEAGCQLLEKEYKNANTSMSYKCNCGNVSKIRLGSFTSGTRCQKCAGNKKYIYQEVKEIFEKENCVLLDKKYLNNITPLNYVCSCGNKSKIRLYSFLKGTRCKKCGREKNIKANRKYTYENVKKIFENANCFRKIILTQRFLYYTNVNVGIFQKSD